MKKYLILLALFAFFLFPSCEKEALEPETNVSLELDAVAKSHDHNQVMTFKAHLTGEQEVPPVDTRATGQTIFKLSKDGSRLSYKLIVANLEDIVMAHIHLAPAGENGPVAVWLYPAGPPPQLIPGTTNGILAQGVITEDDLVGPLKDATLEDLLEIMVAGNAYVNIHTTEYGGGEIRGQISANNSMHY